MIVDFPAGHDLLGQACASPIQPRRDLRDLRLIQTLLATLKIDAEGVEISKGQDIGTLSLLINLVSALWH